jgi:hypothetical protein
MNFITLRGYVDKTTSTEFKIPFLPLKVPQTFNFVDYKDKKIAKLAIVIQIISLLRTLTPKNIKTFYLWVEY